MTAPKGSPEVRFMTPADLHQVEKIITPDAKQNLDAILSMKDGIEAAFSKLPDTVKSFVEQQPVEGQITDRAAVIKRQIARLLGKVDIPQFEHTSVSARRYATERPRYEDAGGHHQG